MTGRRPKLNADQRRRLREWHANRRTLREVAAELGIAVSTARNYLNDTQKTFWRMTA
jgi:hypothetical protein